MTRTSMHTQARAAAVNPIAIPNWTRRSGRKLQCYSGFHSAISDSPTELNRITSGFTTLSRTLLEPFRVTGPDAACPFDLSRRHHAGRGNRPADGPSLVSRGLATLFAVLMLGMGSVAIAANHSSKHFEIKAKPLAAALMEFGVQSGLTVVAPTTLTAGKNAPSVRGDLAPTDALKRLLKGSGLTFARAADGTIAVQAISPSGSGPVQATAGESGLETDLTPSPGLAEIIVTAQKREERLQDVPVPVTAINAQTLVDNNELRLQDYYRSVPGLTLTPDVESGQNLAIRGITTGQGTNPPVAIAVDDAPFGASTYVGGGATVPDFDPGDLARIEVLRGPQGTLYGVSSIGGLIKFVTLDPSTDGVSGRLQAGTSSVYNGAELGYNARGSVNIPLSDTAAIRASGFTREDPGYIDNPVYHLNGVNKDTAYGGHLSLLWRPSESFSLKLGALYQNIKGDGLSEVDVPTVGFAFTNGLSGLQQNYLPGLGNYDRKVQAYSATVTGRVGSAELNAISAYNINAFTDSIDLTPLVGPLVQLAFPTGSGTNFTDDYSTDKFSQEIRLSMPLSHNIDWLLGAFYTHESSHWVYQWLAVTPPQMQMVGTFLNLNTPSTYEDMAAFTDLTFHITNRFSVQLGGREARIRQTFIEQFAGPYNTYVANLPSEALFTALNGHSSANAFTYLLTPQFKVTSDLMVYARLASGYRAGGPNTFVPGVPTQYQPDKTQNYEIGFKGELLDHRLSIDTSIYYINWQGIQLGLVAQNNAGSYTANAGGAKSEGVEFSVESRPFTGLTLGAWVTYSNAVLTQAFPPGAVLAGTYGAAGDRLPFSPRFSANGTVNYEFPLVDNWEGFVGGTVSYVGDRKGAFTSSPTRQDDPAYTETNLRAGVKHDSWAVNLYANNIFDQRGVLNGGTGYLFPYAFIYIQPRTIGLSVTKLF